MPCSIPSPVLFSIPTTAARPICTAPISTAANFAAKRGIASPFLYWEALDEQLIDLALACIPPLHLKRAFERILQNIKANRSGFPDLIQFWPAEQRYHMIEVKGPGDRLQDNQLRWIDYCATHQMPISVCYLKWAA